MGQADLGRMSCRDHACRCMGKVESLTGTRKGKKVDNERSQGRTYEWC